jgi:hypothetical protein
MLPQATVVHSSKLLSKLWEKRARVNVDFMVYARLVIKIRPILSFLSFFKALQAPGVSREYIQIVFEINIERQDLWLDGKSGATILVCRLALPCVNYAIWDTLGRFCACL